MKATVPIEPMKSEARSELASRSISILYHPSSPKPSPCSYGNRLAPSNRADDPRIARARCDQGIEGAWKRLVPSFARKPKQTTKPPPREGWDEIVQIIYETNADESRALIALVRRKGAMSYISLIDGTGAGF